MPRALIFGNGDIKGYSRIKHTINVQSNDIIICADGGARHALRLNLTPDVIIGDMDSISPATRKRLKKNRTIKWIKYPEEKDQTDSQLAIDYAVTQGCTSMNLLGFIGGRTDHFLATLFYLANQPLGHVEIISDQETMYILRNKFVLKGKKGKLFSLVPLFGDVNDIKVTGAKYPLKNETLKLGSTRGVSNVINSHHIIVEFSTKTPLLLIV